MTILQFTPFSSTVSPAFWHALTELKIDVLKLSDDAVDVAGSYGPGRSIVDRETGQEVVLGCGFNIEGDAFKSPSTSGSSTIRATGTFKNFNTIEEFKGCDKAALFSAEADKIYNSITTTRSTALLSHFFLLSFADLKKYKYYYWFGFPAFVSKPAWEIQEGGWRREGFSQGEIQSIDASINHRAFFLVKHTPNGEVQVGDVEQWESFFTGVPADQRTIGFIDPSASPTSPGWPLRNLLAYLSILYPEEARSVRVLRWRGVTSWDVGTVVLPSASNTTCKPSAVGWERNPAGKLGARMADLGGMMDPVRLAGQAVDLNLKLMRWRILPQLDLPKIAETKCLLLGAGTLGCYVARGLMGWGVRNITFVDSAKVSFSNPVRQPLFDFEDCKNGGKPKAQCAADALKRVFPGMNATGHSLSIPMPGHPIPPGVGVEQAKKDARKLEELVKEHDAVFLLMDSRESRWLPTVLGAVHGKIVLNAALGFDTYLVMRHGARASNLKPGERRLGCYYCNDVVAPGDSLTDRTLDQMCTVTRPGLAPIAAATAVEIMTSVLQHPEGIHAQPPPPTTASGGSTQEFLPTSSYADQGHSVLGIVPHQIRGFLAQFRNLQLVGAGWDKCTGCSETVLQAYETQGFEFLLKVFNEEKYLEKLTGLDKLEAEAEAALEGMEEFEDGDSGDDF